MEEEYLIKNYSLDPMKFGYRRIDLLIYTAGGETMSIGKELLKREEVFQNSTQGKVTLIRGQISDIKNQARQVKENMSDKMFQRIAALHLARFNAELSKIPTHELDKEYSTMSTRDKLLMS